MHESILKSVLRLIDGQFLHRNPNSENVDWANFSWKINIENCIQFLVQFIILFFFEDDASSR